MGLIKSANAPISLSAFSMKDIENQAKVILLRARHQAEKLLAEAQTEAENLKKQAYAQGFADGNAAGLSKGAEEGKQSGHEAALNEHRQKLSTLIKTLTEATTQLDASRHDLEIRGLKQVIELAAAIGRRVTKRQGLVAPEVLAANLTEAMKLVVHGADVRIAVHPTQRQILQDELPRLRVAWPRLKHVELIDDPQIAPGGCKVFTVHGQIDADLNTQLDRVINDLLPQ